MRIHSPHSCRPRSLDGLRPVPVLETIVAAIVADRQQLLLNQHQHWLSDGGDGGSEGEGEGEGSRDHAEHSRAVALAVWSLGMMGWRWEHVSRCFEKVGGSNGVASMARNKSEKVNEHRAIEAIDAIDAILTSLVAGVNAQGQQCL